jgi:hypothetical protein
MNVDMKPTSLAEIAARHGVSEAVANLLLDALRRTGGRQAQFDHPELGGMGQWMPGMTMVGRMGDTALKAKVDALCAELAALAVANPADAPLPTFSAPERWWPEALGIPSSVGGQNDLAYAHFAGSRRVAVRRAGTVTLYDTTGYAVHGISAQQQSGGGGTLTLSTDCGPVPLEHLPVVGPS